jgi:hypothetical protein
MNPEKKKEYSTHIIISLLSGIIILLAINYQSMKETHLNDQEQIYMLNTYVDDIERFIYQERDELELRVKKVEEVCKQFRKR